MSLQSINYLSMIYGLLFLSFAFIITLKTGQLKNASAKNIFWSLIAFSTMKSVSIFSGVFSDLLSGNYAEHISSISSLTTVSCVISNVFLFHFGISVLTYKTFLKLDYKIFPLLLFVGFMILNFLAIIDFSRAEEISRFSFGFNGALLGSIGCFNIYTMKHSADSKHTFSGFLICGIALLLIAFTEGLMTRPILGIQLSTFRMSSAIILFTSAFFFPDLMKGERNKTSPAKSKIGFI